MNRLITPHLLDFLILLALVVGLSGRARGDDQAPIRSRTSFDADWRFQKGDPAGVGDSLSYARIKDAVIASSAAFLSGSASIPTPRQIGTDVPYVQSDFDDSGWRKLDVPHDWGIEGAFDQKLPGATGKLPWAGVGWYRKHFETLPSIAGSGRRIYIDFDGAMAYATVWCNGRFVGGWPYGYASFRLDLTPYLAPDGKNVLAVRLDNPPDSSRWYPGSGIYRHVWLVETSSLHVAHWGTQMTTPEVNAQSATLKLTTILENNGGQRDAEVKTEIFACGSDGHATGAPVASMPAVQVTVPAGLQKSVETSAAVSSPSLWDLDHPNRYAAVTTVLVNGQPVDRYETVFGIRTSQFSADNGFLLNGKRVQIHGVCGHHDLGALGTALNLQALERQFTLLKEAGCNAFRTSHNPPAPEFLELCDRMGILVMDESFDCWETGKTRNDYHLLFDDWAEKDIRALVRRDRNHPSVILWSIGNEIPDQGKPKGPALAAKLTGLVHQEDATRPTTSACNSIASGYNAFRQGVDVFGYNYKPEEYPKFHAANPTQPLIGSETSSGYNSRGEYFFPVTEDRRGGQANFQVSSYDFSYDNWATGTEREFRGEDKAPYVAGEFVWTGFDYLGEPTPFDDRYKGAPRGTVPSRSSYFGIFDLAGFPKDRFYLYQSHWRPDLPMAHILPHWTWPGREGQVTPVHVYTSGDEAELFLNGISLGRKRKAPGEYRIRWDDVKYEPGELKVIAYKNGVQWAEDSETTAGPAAKIILREEPVMPGGGGLIYVDATITDNKGNPAPQAASPLHFSVTGPAQLVATDNGDATNHTAFQSPDRHAYNGKCLAILKASPSGTGSIAVRADSDGLQSSTLPLPQPGI